MAHFAFAVSGQVLDLLTPMKGISDELYVNSCEFDFRSHDWDNLDKWAHFSNADYNNGESYDYNLVGDSISPERGLNLPAGIWEVYLTGNLILNNEVVQRRVTESQSIQILQSNVVNAEPLASMPPSIAEQVNAKATEALNARITTASGIITKDEDDNTPYVDMVIRGQETTKELFFDFHNIVGASAYEYAVEHGYTGTEEEFGLLMANIETYSEAAVDSALEAEAWAKGTRGGEPVVDGQDGYNDNSKYYKDAATSQAQAAWSSAQRADSEALISEGFAVGEQDGVPVSTGSAYYENNSKYYCEQASSSKNAAANSASSATSSALKAEGYAVGKQNGSAVSSGTYYHNNAEYYNTQAGESASASANSASESSDYALNAEGLALGTQNGVDVPSGSPYYDNNAKYYCEQAEYYADRVIGVEHVSNKVTSVDEASTDEQYPSAKCVYDIADNIHSNRLAYDDITIGETLFPSTSITCVEEPLTFPAYYIVPDLYESPVLTPGGVYRVTYDGEEHIMYAFDVNGDGEELTLGNYAQLEYWNAEQFAEFPYTNDSTVPFLIYQSDTGGSYRLVFQHFDTDPHTYKIEAVANEEIKPIETKLLPTSGLYLCFDGEEVPEEVRTDGRIYDIYTEIHGVTFSELLGAYDRGWPIQIKMINYDRNQSLSVMFYIQGTSSYYGDVRMQLFSPDVSNSVIMQLESTFGKYSEVVKLGIYKGNV